MPTKRFQVGFFVGRVGADGRGGRISQALRAWTAGTAPVAEMGGYRFELRDMHVHNNGALYHGVFAKFRVDALPHIGTAGEATEEEIQLEADQALIEKNHFLYFRDRELLVYQANGHGSNVDRLGEYFTSFFDTAAVFDPVLKANSMHRLMRGEVTPRKFEVSFAAPQNPDWIPRNQWNRSALDLLAGSRAQKANITVSAAGRGATRQTLRNIGSALNELIEHTVVSVAKVTIDEQEYPIDLIADRLRATIDVPMDGRYPDPARIYHELRRAYDAQRNAIREILGNAEHTLA